MRRVLIFERMKSPVCRSFFIVIQSENVVELRLVFAQTVQALVVVDDEVDSKQIN